MNSLEPSYNFSDFPLPSGPSHSHSHSPITPSTGAPAADSLLSNTEQDHFMSFLADNFGPTSANPAAALYPGQADPNSNSSMHYPVSGQEYGMHYPSWGAPPPPHAHQGQPQHQQGYAVPPPGQGQGGPMMSSGSNAGQLPPISSLTSLPSTASNPSLSRPLLTAPQKRENHILSEQKRRNQIRQSYALLSLLLEGPEAGPGSNPVLKGTSGVTREMIYGGQVKGKKGRARGGGKKQGKAGTLFRAVEYARWLQEGNEQLQRDVGEIRDRLQRWGGGYEHKGFGY